MTRRRSAASGFFDMPAEIAKAAISTLKPEQRDAIKPADATAIMAVAVRAASEISRIIDPPAQTEPGPNALVPIPRAPKE